ncbi:response regulator, partial [Paenibacillus massiliensis]|uniref:response regulator n=1 Tax=Paenibacillus massiliensis TaxID=225917 RepID=UPI00046F9961
MYRVLIVDDEPAIREGLTTLIDWEACGFQVADTAGNGREALEKLEKLAPRLVIMDIRMPGMSGLEVIRTIRDQYSADTSSHPISPHVLLLTGYADFEYARQAIAYGVDGYLLKPVDEEEMMSELKRIHKLITAEQHQQHTWHHTGQEQQEATLERIMESLLLGTREIVKEHLQEPMQTIPIPAGLRDWSAYQVLLL